MYKMSEDFLDLQRKINLLSSKENLVTVLIYGSAVSGTTTAGDFDVILVAKRVDSTLKEIFDLFNSRYINLDLDAYSEKEITNHFSFYTREFKLEYLAKGLCVYGVNVFKKELLHVDDYQYRQSILVRSIEHLRMVRRRYFSVSGTYNERLNFIKKYFLRISRNILLFKRVGDHSFVYNLNQTEVFKKLIELNMLNVTPNIEEINNLDELFSLFGVLSEALIKCKKEFDVECLTSQKP